MATTPIVNDVAIEDLGWMIEVRLNGARLSAHRDISSVADERTKDGTRRVTSYSVDVARLTNRHGAFTVTAPSLSALARKLATFPDELIKPDWTR